MMRFAKGRGLTAPFVFFEWRDPGTVLLLALVNTQACKAAIVQVVGRVPFFCRLLSLK
ncbi:hypothetical protein EMIT0P294_100225 [Pseudomonas sp. IT-P294]